MKRISRAERPRRGRLPVGGALIATLALSLAACAGDLGPSAPQLPQPPAASQPANDLLGGLVSGVGETLTSTLSNLRLFDCATPAFGTVKQTVGPLGGVIRIGPHSLFIPAGALDRPVAITASAPEAQHVTVDFAPEGLRFRYPAVLRLSYAHCDHRPLLPRVVYINDLLSILELLPSLDDLAGQAVTTKLRHFSGYAIAD
jgi:hypothetical protein